MQIKTPSAKESVALKGLLSLLSSSQQKIQSAHKSSHKGVFREQQSSANTTSKSTQKSKSRRLEKERTQPTEEEKEIAINNKYKLFTAYFNPLLQTMQAEKTQMRSDFLERQESLQKERQVRLQLLRKEAQQNESAENKSPRISRGTKAILSKMGQNEPIHERSQKIIAKKQALLELKRQKQKQSRQTAQRQQQQQLQHYRNTSRSRSPNQTYFQDSERWYKKKQAHVQKERAQRDQHNLRDCTFSPSLSTGSKRISSRPKKQPLKAVLGESQVVEAFMKGLQGQS